MTAAKTPKPSPEYAAFEQALLSARPRLWRFALRLTKDRAAADDLVQDALVKAWAARLRFEHGSNMPAWLFRIARNAFLSGVRRTRRDVAWDPDRHQAMLVQGALQEDALYARDFDSAWSRLPGPQRSALLLVSRDGMSIADAADQLGVPSGTVKSRVSRARAAMLAFVEGEVVIVESKSMVALDDLAAQISIGETHRLSKEPARLRYESWKASGGTMIG